MYTENRWFHEWVLVQGMYRIVKNINKNRIRNLWNTYINTVIPNA